MSSPVDHARNAHDTREHDALVHRVASTVRTGLPELVERLCESVEQALPEELRHVVEKDDLHNTLRRISDLFVRVVEERRSLRSEELVTVHVIGAQRARQGVPVDAVIDGMRVALRTVWEAVLRAASDFEPAVALDLVSQLSLAHMEFMHTVLDALETGYATEREQRLSGQVRAQATFVDRLLEGHWDDETRIRSRGSALGYDLGKLCGLLMAMPTGGRDTEAVRSGAAKLAARVPGAFEGPLRTLPCLHVIVVLPVASPTAWTDALETVAEVARHERLLVVPVDPTPLVSSLAHLYRRAQRYLRLAHSAGSGPGIVTVRDLRLYAVLARIPLNDRVDFVRDLLGPVLDLPEHKATELLDTLDAVYRRRGRIVEAAADLHLHHNSVRYRLNRIEHLTGLSLDVPAERLHLELAMRLRWVAKAELAWFDDTPSERLRARPA
ncbi:MAG: helix-turn-helix domain-containing protein [Actinobacteria bacterium]|nr:helix-turn-helix domain-containing protein [Actinomycetota bacterium]